MATSPVTTRVPLDIGAIHFIGIGGIGMSGIAEIMHNLGYQVQGSDVSDSANVKRLRQRHSHRGRPQRVDNLKDAHAVVYSSAVKPGNVEFDAARALSLPLVRRAEMLARDHAACVPCVAIRGHQWQQTTTTTLKEGAPGCGQHGSHLWYQWWHYSTPMAPMRGWAPAVMGGGGGG